MSIPARLVVVIPLACSIVLLLLMFAGIAWVALFLALLNVLLGLIPFNARLARFLLGAQNYGRSRNTLEKAARSVIVKISLVIFTLFYLLLALGLSATNIRLVDYLR